MSVVWQKRTHGVFKRQEQTNRMFARLFISVVVVVTVLAAAYLALIAANVRLAREVWAIQYALMDVQRENQALRIDIAQHSSIPVLQQKSVELRYQPANSVDFIYVGEGP